MKNILQCFILLIICSSTMIAQNSYLDWFIQAGGRSNEIARDIYVDNFGFIYSVSEVTDTTVFPDTTFATNFSDICLTKMNPNGEIIWIRLMGGSGLDRGLDIMTDNNDDIIVTGFFSGSALFGDTTLVSSGFTDVFVAKYNPNGVFQWVVQGDGPNHDEGLCIAIDDLNDIYIGGYFESSLQIGPYTLNSTGTYETLFYTKISSNGVVLWAKQAYTLDYTESYVESICFDGFDIVLTGSFDDTMIFDGDTLYSYDGSYDVFIAKIDITGTKVWIKQAGGDYDDGGSAIITDDSGNIYLAGYFAHTANFGTFQFTSTDNNSDVFISGLDGNGNFTWADHGSGIGYDYPTSISYNPTNGLSVCGVTTEGFEIGGSSFVGNASDDIFIVNYFTSGILKNVLYTGGLGEERSFDVYLDDNNSGYVVGSFLGSMQIDDKVIVAQNILMDLYIAKINFNNLTDVSDDIKDASLNKYILLQNYPNPFNPSTTIKYSIPSSVMLNSFQHLTNDETPKQVRGDNMNASLKVYDILGREIATLVNEQQKPGNYKVEWNTIHQSSGVYFYRIRAGEFVETKKMILLR